MTGRKRPVANLYSALSSSDFFGVGDSKYNQRRDYRPSNTLDNVRSLFNHQYFDFLAPERASTESARNSDDSSSSPYWPDVDFSLYHEIEDFKRVEFFVVPFVLNVIFTLEAMLRYFVAPVKKKFFMQINNVIDMVAVLPFWLIRFLMVDHWFPTLHLLPWGISLAPGP